VKVNYQKSERKKKPQFIYGAQANKKILKPRLGIGSTLPTAHPDGAQWEEAGVD